MEAGGVNYYPFHIGDYASHTAHLEPLEDLAYRRMLDLYYVREQALPESAAEIARLIRMKKNVAEVQTVLREFFTNNDGDGWIHMRCEEEIASFKRMGEGGKRGAAKRWAKQHDSHPIATTSPPHADPNSNQNQNQEPEPTTAPKVRSGRGSRLPNDWAPMSDGWEFARSLGIAAEAIENEAGRFIDYWRSQPGQKGVKTDWPATWRNWCRKAAENVKPNGAQSFSARDSAAKAARLAEMTGGLLGAPQRPSNVIDMEEGNAPLRIA
jgi:uncharacterized protein YdaU (DUF1376 family)